MRVDDAASIVCQALHVTAAAPTVSPGGCTRRVRMEHSPAAAAAASSTSGQVNDAHHVEGCRFTQETRVLT